MPSGGITVGFQAGPLAVQLSRVFVGAPVTTSSATIAGGSGGPLQITTAGLPGAVVGTAYSFAPAATGGNPPYAWNILSCTPNWMLWLQCLDGQTFTGIPQNDETESVTYQVTDSSGQTAQTTEFLAVTVSGALTIVTSSLPFAVNNSMYQLPLYASGGDPPYEWGLNVAGTKTATPGTNTFTLPIGASATGFSTHPAPNGMLQCAPTTAENVHLTLYCRDNAGTNANSASLPITISSSTTAITIIGAPPDGSTMKMPMCRQGNLYQHYAQAVGGGTGYTWTIAGGQLPAGLSLSVVSWSSYTNVALISGTPTGNAGAAFFILQATSSAGNNTQQHCSIQIQQSGQVSRPAYNTGSGFFVLNGGLYDPNGYPFIMRGADRAHFDTDPVPALVNMQQSCSRMFIYHTESPADVVNTQVTTYHANNDQACVPTVQSGMTGSFTSTLTSGSASLPLLGNVLLWWISNAAALTPIINAKSIINIANEWSPGGNDTGASPKWQASYQGVSAPVTGVTTTTLTFSGTSPFNANNTGPGGIGYVYLVGVPGVANGIYAVTANGASTLTGTFPNASSGSGGTVYAGAVGMLRAVGFTCPLMIDSESDAKNIDVMTGANGTAVFNSDPLGSIIYTFHAYSIPTVSTIYTECSRMAAAGVSIGAHYAIMEMGPGGASSNSQTIPSSMIISAAESYGLSWNVWAYDDEPPFIITTTHYPAAYVVPSNLSPYGMDVVFNPVCGFQALAQPAPYFL